MVTYPKVGIDNVRQYFKRHVQGDWGSNGTFDPAPLTAEQVWAIGLEQVVSPGRRNDHAVQSGLGIIISEYDRVRVVTVLAPGRRSTFIDGNNLP